MKNSRNFVALICILLVVISGMIAVSAADIAFSTESLEQEEIETILSNINITKLSNEPSKKVIQCFSVNTDGTIAVGCGSYNKKTVCIYNSEGIFQYGYSFQTAGSFGIELKEDILYIYFVRSDIALAIDPDGQINSVTRIQNTVENNSYWNHSVFSTKISTEQYEYVIKNNLGIFNVFASSYSLLTKTDVYGNETVIYDVNNTQQFRVYSTLFFIVVFLSIGVYTLFFRLRKSRL